MCDPFDNEGAHRSWEEPDKAEEFDGLKDANPDNWQSWVVKLQFIKDGAKNWGTGFYINLHSSKYSVILTAGHNLISETGTPVEDLRILRAPPQTDLPVLKDSIKICRDYEGNPSPKNRVNDYGAILLPLDPNQGGFGFAIKFGLSAELPANVRVYVTGHRQQPDGELAVAKTNSGTVRLAKRSYLRYKVSTITGNSGGPVWIPHQGLETVIGIHNYGADSLKDPNAPSQGTRLSLDVYRDICRWAELGWTSKSVKVRQSRAPPLGLYLRFAQSPRFGRVRLGPEELDTRFDIMPGWTNSGVLDQQSMKFIFMFEEPSSWYDDEDDEDESTQPQVAPPLRFVRWKADPRRSEVLLTEEFHEECLVQLSLKPKLKAYEIIQHYGEDMWKLRMQMNKIEMPRSEEDREGFWNLYESSEIDFVRSREKTSKFPFTLFGFE